MGLGQKKPREIDLHKAKKGMREYFPPEKWGERLEEIWVTAGKRGSAKTQMMVLDFVANRLIGRPVQSVEIEKNETRRLIAMLDDAPVFTVEAEQEPAKLLESVDDETV